MTDDLLDEATRLADADGWPNDTPDVLRALVTRVREAEAERDRLRTEHHAFTDSLDYGDGRTEPAAPLADLVEPIQEAFDGQREHQECPVLCEGCGERLAATRCEHCNGSGQWSSLSGYRECEYCAGAGRVHAGCAEASYTDLVTERDEARAQLDTVRAVASKLIADVRGALDRDAVRERLAEIAPVRNRDLRTLTELVDDVRAVLKR